MSVGFLSDDQESRRYWVFPDSQSKSGTKSPQKCPALTISSSNPKVCINQQRLGLTWGSESKSSNLVKFEMFSFKGVVLRWVYLCLHPIYRLITEPPQLFPIFMCQSGNKEEKKSLEETWTQTCRVLLLMLGVSGDQIWGAHFWPPRVQFLGRTWF